MTGYQLTAQHVLSLASLPRLTFLEAIRGYGAHSKIAQVEEAHRRTRQQLSRGAAPSADDTGPELMRDAQPCALSQPPLGPHQQQEMRLRVMQYATTRQRGKEDDRLLGWTEEVDPGTVRAVFFAELQCVLTPSRSGRGRMLYHAV